MLSDDNKAQIKTIEAQLRRLGLTEEQIALHLTPLRSKAEKPQPIRQKAGTFQAPPSRISCALPESLSSPGTGDPTAD